MVVYPYSNKGKPGSWNYFAVEGALKVSFTCPYCKSLAVLDHKVGMDGTVSPSVVCPNDRCDFHQNIFLADWNVFPQLHKDLRA